MLSIFGVKHSFLRLEEKRRTAAVLLFLGMSLLFISRDLVSFGDHFLSFVEKKSVFKRAFFVLNLGCC